MNNPRESKPRQYAFNLSASRGRSSEGAAPEALPWDCLQSRALSCERCALRATCTQVVFGAGDRGADLVLIGEAPGAEEDRTGMPFVGRAGQLLDRILEACHLNRDEVFITNIVKCRPPANRTPTPSERDTCMPFLEEQIRLIQPKVIVTMGAAATQGLLDPQARITRIRGTWHKWQGIPLMPTFHPAFLLRDPRKKAPTWEDFQQVMARIRGEGTTG